MATTGNLANKNPDSGRQTWTKFLLERLFLVFQFVTSCA